jgi:putative tricarboxylic transport membrane protein
MRTHDLVSSIIFFSTGLFILLYAPRFDLGRVSEPGPGFMPFLAGLIICMFALITFLSAFFDKSGGTERIWVGIKVRRIILTLSMLISYSLLLEAVGFIICTFFLILILVRYAGSQPWLKSFFAGGLSSLLSYLLFEMWLKAQLPKGIFGL